MLRVPCAPVLKQDFGSPRLRKLVDDMNVIMDKHVAMGLSAPQLGVPLQVCAYQYLAEWMTEESAEDDRLRGVVATPRTFLVNPKVKVIGTDVTIDMEACLSIDNLCALVKRARVVEITARDLEDRPVQFRAENYMARILQHELDHLRGILFVDRMYTRTLRTIDMINAPIPDNYANLPDR